MAELQQQQHLWMWVLGEPLQMGRNPQVTAGSRSSHWLRTDALASRSLSLLLPCVSLCYLPCAMSCAALLCSVQFFVVGHDCGHRSFHDNNLIEDIVGTLMFMPLLYPFEPWRIKHNHHHAHTNK